MVWDIVWPQIIVFFAVIVYGSFFEWTLHRFIMHKRTIISYPFELHALLHHKYQVRNLNVVLPIADLVIGTLVRRPKEDAVVLEV